MQIVLLINPIAGRGRARELVSSGTSFLRRAGYEVTTLDRPPTISDDLAPFDAAAVVGGDGTLNRWLPQLSFSKIPVWHLPLGTENLFARTFGHRPSFSQFARALRRLHIRQIDLGMCGTRLFSIMMSIGPDADVVEAVSRMRSGAITRLNYVLPIATRLLRPVRTQASITADMKQFVHGRLGMCVVANLPSYATGLNPAWEARSDDGLLTAVHLPGRGAASIGLRVIAGLGRDASVVPGREVRHGSTVIIQSDDRPAVQIDGDLMEPAEWAAGNELTVRAVPKALSVLLPGD